MNKVIAFDKLEDADLFVDAVYEGGTAGNTGDDPLNRLLHCGNQGGFRKVGSSGARYVVLYSSLDDRDWPDVIDPYTGLFTYYGDNKTPGHLLHETPRGGNKILREVFQEIHASPDGRRMVPPFFIFTKLPTSSSRSVQFRGLAVPGGQRLSSNDDLVAIWKSAGGQRFQNYRAIYTILDVPTVSRAWLEDLRVGDRLSTNAPTAWRRWVERGIYKALLAQPVITFRSENEQVPASENEQEIVISIYEYFKDDPTGFESCAATIAAMLDPRVGVDVITRATADGGRDAIGRYKLGPLADPIYMDFALEAKCYCPGLRKGEKRNSVGVREVSRLVSRLRHR